MKIRYVDHKFNRSSLSIIQSAEEIIKEYVEQGYDLTLRQLYYQFVSRDLIANKQSEYKRLGSVINDARLAGLIDWDCITDRTRQLEHLSHWHSPESIIESAAKSFRIDKWQDQPHRIEVWIEKDALLGVIEGICDELDVAYFSCRGYTSQSAMWEAGQRFIEYAEEDQQPTILHFGDHDPSGIDMTRDISDRLNIFCRPNRIEVKRVALTMDQVEKYRPPPNPAKITDSRFNSYAIKYGRDSWELDALEPSVMADLIKQEVELLGDPYLWATAVEEEEKHRTLIGKVAKKWNQIKEELN